jgi:hypothetical protein
MQDTRIAPFWRGSRLLPAAILLCAAVGGCKKATGLHTGRLNAAGPVLIHAPMGFERVRFRYRDTGADFEHKQSLFEGAGGGQSTRVNGNVATITNTSVYARAGEETQEGVRTLSARTWAANVHVDLARWTFFPLLFFVGRTYVEAQGDVVGVEGAR